MIKKDVDPLTIYFFENLFDLKDIDHFVSTRADGFSGHSYRSLNLGFHVEDDSEKVLKNREKLSSSIKIPLKNFTIANQIHGSDVKIITERLRGKGAFKQETAIKDTDAMVTNIPNICLVILVADCVPILFFDPVKKVIGAAHAGLGGTVKLVAQNVIDVFQKEFNSAVSDIIVGIGPSIGPCCYEVGPEVITQVEKIFGNKKDYVTNESPDGKGYLDLWEANKKQLLQKGILEKNIEIAKICTYCNSNLFFSRRYQKEETGRFGTGIMIKSE